MNDCLFSVVSFTPMGPNVQQEYSGFCFTDRGALARLILRRKAGRPKPQARVDGVFVGSPWRELPKAGAREARIAKRK
jgi:hypothetical protein